MKCPFLRDANVKYCEASAYRKMIQTGGSDAAAERCSSPAYTDCQAAAARLLDAAPQDHCPFLHEAQAEFCGAAPQIKYIPATNDLFSHCNSGGHLYCELYLAHADPQGERRPRQSRRGDCDGAQIPRVDGMPVPPRLAYAPNHMWLDVAEDGVLHVGLDAFAAKVIASIEQISFLRGAQPAGPAQPIAVITVNGADMQMVFPNPLFITAANVYLRTSPERLLADPYGTGWLFEGVVASSAENARAGLIDGAEAVAWFRSESDRLNAFVHQRTARPDSEGAAFMNDGGSVVDGVSAHLDREDLLALVNEFFSPQLAWRRS
jgi:glycine cleavage system H protein